MVRSKQTARQSTGGKAPRWDLMQLAARSPRNTCPTQSDTSGKVIEHLAVSSTMILTGLLKRRDYSESEIEVTLPCHSIQPLVTGFLKLLGKDIFVPVQTLQILLDDNISADDNSAGAEVLAASDLVPFELMRLIHDPNAAKENDKWYIQASGRRANAELPWHRVSALSCSGMTRKTQISFAEFAEEDPSNHHLWNPTAKQAARILLNTFHECKTQLEAQGNFDTRRLASTISFPHGSRIPSTTPIRHVANMIPVPFTEEDDPGLSCVTSSLANIVSQENFVFAEWLIDNAPENFLNLRELANFLQRSSASFPETRTCPYSVIKCLPAELSSLSPRDPTYQTTLREKSRRRLDWILSQETGDFVAIIIASDFHSNHVVGISVSRRLIFDHEIRRTLPLSHEGFDATCGGQTTCLGLGEVREVVQNISRKRIRNATPI
jgi:hypothetical protein